MTRKYQKSIFIFRRDLRLQDNTGLIEACNQSEIVVPIFIFDENQLQKKNQYYSQNAFQFMLESLDQLDQTIRKRGSQLFFLKGSSAAVLDEIIQDENLEAVFVNHDYTPFAKKRDGALQEVCQKNNIDFKHFADYLLNEPEKAVKDNGTPYLVFTPFWKNARNFKVNDPHRFDFHNLYTGTLKQHHNKSDLFPQLLPQENPKLLLKGGRAEAIKILKNLDPHYDDGRDFPAQSTTTHLSAHHKFGTLSIRESYHQLKKFYGPDHTVLSELYWRDFFTHIAYHFPKVFGQAFQDKFNNLSWDESEEKFQTWCEGRTGFPIVDAGMRELNTTGYMHNRVRMITAGFLIKNLGIDWRKGEKYFAQKLIDYDPCVNNGNWQWAASTGVDAQPFFRIFNPWRQQERFDAEGEYVKKWCPELSEVDPKDLKKWEEKHEKYEVNYPTPIVEHKASSQKTKDKYKAAHEAAK